MRRQGLITIRILVFILTSGLPAIAAEMDGNQIRSSLEEANAIAAQLKMNQTNALERAIRAAEQAQERVDALARNGGGQTNTARLYRSAVQRYAKRLQNLGSRPHPDTLKVLFPAVGHPEAQVRKAALIALREGAANNPQAPVLNQVYDMILNDSVIEVRREAFEVYCRWGDRDDLLLLSMELGREAGPLQDLAVREWIRVEKERLARAHSVRMP
jgi:hypothetical protein